MYWGWFYARGHPFSRIILFFWGSFPDLAQGFYSTLTIFGIPAVPLGGIYLFVAGAWLGGLADHRRENRGALWRVLFTVYAVGLVAIATPRRDAAESDAVSSQ